MGKEQELVQAIKNNDVEFVKKVLAKFKIKSKKTNKKSGIHIIDQDGFAPLHHAALAGNGEIVMQLLEFTSDVNVKDKKGMTPLHLAAWAGKVEPALLLLDAGAETNLCARSGATPLHLASEHGNYVVVERLVDHNCDPTVVNNKGETALDLACRFGHLEVVRILLNNSHGKCVKLLNPKEFQEKASPLHMAAKTGHFDVVRLLVEAGADVNQKGPSGTCLHEAALYGKTEVVKFLLESGIDVNLKNREGETALDIVTKFTKSGASSEIKHLLREALVEVVYAKAIKDYANIKDDSFLTLRLGDIVLVLDRRKDGMWKGCIRDEQKERIGYFPASAVKVLRSPSRNSVVRSSTSSTETPKISTMATVSNSFEIVTVAPPNQPVAGKSRAPRMSSFRKKAPKSTEPHEPPRAGNKRNTMPIENGDSSQDAIDATPRRQSENDLDERKKKLNYLDIILVDKKNPIVPRSTSVSVATRTDYADVWLPKTPDPTKTADTQKTKTEISNDCSHQEQQQQQQQEQEVFQSVAPAKEICPPLPMKARHYTMASAHVTSTGDLPPLPLKKRHSLSGRPSVCSISEPSLPPKLEKKNRASLRNDRRGTSSPPPPPPPPPISNTPSPATTEPPSPATTEPPSPVATGPPSPATTEPPSPATTEPPSPVATGPPSPVATGPPSPVATGPPSPVATGPPSPVATGPPSPATTEPPSPATTEPPSPATTGPPSPVATGPPSSITERNTLTVAQPSHLALSPSPPPPPPPLPPPPMDEHVLSSPSTASLDDFPPPPPSSIHESSTSLEVTPAPTINLLPPDLDYANHEPERRNTSPLLTNGAKLGDEVMENSAVRSGTTGKSRGGYEDMSRLLFARTKSDVSKSEVSKSETPKSVIPLDKKGYVLVTPPSARTPPGARTPADIVASELRPGSSPLLYQNFTSLRTNLRNEKRSVSEPTVASSFSLGQYTEDTSSQKSLSTVTSKPEKPERHHYVNCELFSDKGVVFNDSSGVSTQETEQHNSSEADDGGYLNMSGEAPVAPISIPVPIHPQGGVTNLRMREYDELYDWLAQSKLLAYMDNFASAGFDLTAMAGLTVEDLCEIQINKMGHRKRLLSEAAKIPQSKLSCQKDVPSWLDHLGLSQYLNQFMDGGFDDIEFLNDLSTEDLLAIGVTKVGHQRKILMAAQRLQQRDTYNPSPVITEIEEEVNERSVDKESSHRKHPPDRNEEIVGVVSEYAVPKVSHYNEIKPGSNSETPTELPDEFGWSQGLLNEQNCSTGADINYKAKGSDQVAVKSPNQLSGAQTFDKDTDIESLEHKTEMNGMVADQDSVDGVKELAATFQQTIVGETEKAKRVPPPVKPKSFKKGPPVVAPKPKPGGHRAGKVLEDNSNSATDVNSKIDFTNVIKEAEALSEGSESPPSTLGREHKSETSGSQGSLNSESEDFQREIKESLQRKKSDVSSLEDINKELAESLSLSQEDLLEQQKRDEELKKYHSEQSNTDSLFTDIQGMLDNLNSDLDDMFK